MYTLTCIHPKAHKHAIQNTHKLKQTHRNAHLLNRWTQSQKKRHRRANKSSIFAAGGVTLPPRVAHPHTYTHTPVHTQTHFLTSQDFGESTFLVSHRSLHGWRHCTWKHENTQNMRLHTRQRKGLVPYTKFANPHLLVTVILHFGEIWFLMEIGSIRGSTPRRHLFFFSAKPD